MAAICSKLASISLAEVNRSETWVWKARSKNGSKAAGAPIERDVARAPAKIEGPRALPRDRQEAPGVELDPPPRELATGFEDAESSFAQVPSADEGRAAETGAEYIDDLRDDDLPGGPGDPEHSWLGLMKFNFITMTNALGGDASALEAFEVRNVAPDNAEYPQ